MKGREHSQLFEQQAPQVAIKAAAAVAAEAAAAEEGLGVASVVKPGQTGREAADPRTWSWCLLSVGQFYFSIWQYQQNVLAAAFAILIICMLQNMNTDFFFHLPSPLNLVAKRVEKTLIR